MFGNYNFKHIKLLCNFIEITLRHGCSPVNLLHIFETLFLKNTSGWLLLKINQSREWTDELLLSLQNMNDQNKIINGILAAFAWYRKICSLDHQLRFKCARTYWNETEITNTDAEKHSHRCKPYKRKKENHCNTARGAF